MSRAALFVFFLSCAASAQPSAPALKSADAPADFPSESNARANSELYLVEFCRELPEECATAQDVFKDYEAAVAAADECRTKKCSANQLRTLSAQVREIDECEGRLPSLPSPESGRPLLQLSAIASARLSAAAAESKTPYWVAETGSQTDVGLDLVVEKTCLKGLDACRDFRTLAAEGKTLRTAIARCASSPCAFDVVDDLTSRASGALSRYFGKHVVMGPLYALLDADRAAAVGEMALLVAEAMGELKSSADALEKRLAALDLSSEIGGDDAKSLRQDGTAIFESYRRVEVGVDRLNYVLGYEKTSAARDQINAWAGALASLRARGLALLAARGFAAADPKDATPDHPTLLDLRSAPPLPARAPRAPAIMTGRDWPLALLPRLLSNDPVKNAEAKRRLGLTKTIGSPGLYTPQAYEQEGDNTCAIAVQIQILRAHGFLPAGDPVQQERLLAAEAVRRGFLNSKGFRSTTGGTPPEFRGDLLVERGLLISKNMNASWSDLESALRRGHVAQVGVDARELWDDLESPQRLEHSILVTGLEVSKRGDRALGVYINDSGASPPSAGRFVAKKMFLDIWLKSFVEVR